MDKEQTRIGVPTSSILLYFYIALPCLAVATELTTEPEAWGWWWAIACFLFGAILFAATLKKLIERREIGPFVMWMAGSVLGLAVLYTKPSERWKQYVREQAVASLRSYEQDTTIRLNYFVRVSKGNAVEVMNTASGRQIWFPQVKESYRDVSILYDGSDTKFQNSEKLSGSRQNVLDRETIRYEILKQHWVKRMWEIEMVAD